MQSIILLLIFRIASTGLTSNGFYNVFVYLPVEAVNLYILDHVSSFPEWMIKIYKKLSINPNAVWPPQQMLLHRKSRY